jgi:hypothetical protein
MARAMDKKPVKKPCFRITKEKNEIPDKKGKRKGQ